MAFIEINNKKKQEIEAAKARAEMMAAEAAKEKAKADERIARSNNLSMEAQEIRQEINEKFDKLFDRTEELLKSGRGDAIAEIYRNMNQILTTRRDTVAGGRAATILESYTAPTDKENLDLYFATIKSMTFTPIYNNTNTNSQTNDNVFRNYMYWVKKGDKAYDAWFEANTTVLPTEQKELIEELKRIANEAKDGEYDVETLMELLSRYSQVSQIHPHGSHKGEEFNEVGLTVLEMIKERFIVPTEKDALEKFVQALKDNKKELENYSEKYSTLWFKGSMVSPKAIFKKMDARVNPTDVITKQGTVSLYDHFMQEAERIVKNKYPNITEGAFGEINKKAKQKKTILISIAAIVLIIILLCFIL